MWLADTLHGKDGEGSDDGAGAGDHVENAVTAATNDEDRRRDRKGKRAGDVEHAEILGGRVSVRQDIDNQREVHCHVHAEAEPADRHADEEGVEVGGAGDHQQREAIHDWTGSHTLADCLAGLEGAGVPAGPIYTVADIASDPQYAARDML
ncbi:MAG: CoA transferase, partial [Chloroflexota bacterium]|nr:CoA transferase [Chloroflexota bacterium]